MLKNIFFPISTSVEDWIEGQKKVRRRHRRKAVGPPNQSRQEILKIHPDAMNGSQAAQYVGLVPHRFSWLVKNREPRLAELNPERRHYQTIYYSKAALQEWRRQIISRMIDQDPVARMLWHMLREGGEFIHEGVDMVDLNRLAAPQELDKGD